MDACVCVCVWVLGDDAHLDLTPVDGGGDGAVVGATMTTWRYGAGLLCRAISGAVALPLLRCGWVVWVGSEYYTRQPPLTRALIHLMSIEIRPACECYQQHHYCCVSVRPRVREGHEWA